MSTCNKILKDTLRYQCSRYHELTVDTIPQKPIATFFTRHSFWPQSYNRGCGVCDMGDNLSVWEISFNTLNPSYGSPFQILWTICQGVIQCTSALAVLAIRWEPEFLMLRKSFRIWLIRNALDDVIIQ